MKFLYVIIASPFVLFSRMSEVFDLWGIRSDIMCCLEIIDSMANSVPHAFIGVLVAAEDHRTSFHPGVDPIAMIRAVFVRVKCGQIQGASTIEQQFVRVVSKRYKKSIGRKIREQALAIAVSRYKSKTEIASAYLAIAYYGANSIGIQGLKKCCGSNLELADYPKIRRIISQLKYPEPLTPSLHWQIKRNKRMGYIADNQNCQLKKQPAMFRLILKSIH